MYPTGLVRSILRGITLQAEADSQVAKGRDPICAMPMYTPVVSKEGFGPPTHPSVPRFGKKGSVPITYEEPNFKPRYSDEYRRVTGASYHPPGYRGRA